MGSFTPKLVPLPVLCLFNLMGILPQVASGQETLQELNRIQFGLGYVANAPRQMGGLGGYVVSPRWGGIGLYMDFKWDTSNPKNDEEYEAGLTAESVPFEVPLAVFLERKSSYRGFNLALVRPVSPFLMIYGGAGLTERTRFHSFQDPNLNLGRGGIFYAESLSESQNRLNVLVGLMMRLGSRFTSHFGFETEPRGVTAGVSLRIPRW